MSINCVGNCGAQSSTHVQNVSPEASYFCLHAALVAVLVSLVAIRFAACTIHFIR